MADPIGSLLARAVDGRAAVDAPYLVEGIGASRPSPIFEAGRGVVDAVEQLRSILLAPG